MKLLVVFGLAVLALHRSESAPVGVIIGNLLSLTEISLKLGDIISGGCVFVPEICTLRTEIEGMNKVLEPKMKTLLDLHKENNEMYKKMADVIYKNRDIVGIQKNIEELVAGITNTLESKSQILSQLEREFRQGSNRQTNIFQSEVSKFVYTDRSVSTATLMYHELKFTYDRLKKDGQAKQFNNFEEVITAIGKPVIKPLVSPSPFKFTNAYNAISGVSTWLAKPGTKTYVEAFDNFGPVVFSLYGIVANLVFDIQAAIKARDAMRKTRDDMKEIMRTIDPKINTERQAKKDMQEDFEKNRQFFTEVLRAVQYAIFINLDADRLQNADIDTIVSAQTTTINEMEAVGKSQQQVYTRQRQRVLVNVSVKYSDSISEIQQRLRRAGLPTMPEYILLQVIAQDHPNLSKYDGKDLGRYRG